MCTSNYPRCLKTKGNNRKSDPLQSENKPENPDFLKHFRKFCLQVLWRVNGDGGRRMKKDIGALLYADFWK